jgi:hypothetical protein
MVARGSEIGTACEFAESVVNINYRVIQRDLLTESAACYRQNADDDTLFYRNVTMRGSYARASYMTVDKAAEATAWVEARLQKQRQGSPNMTVMDFTKYCNEELFKEELLDEAQRANSDADRMQDEEMDEKEDEHGAVLQEGLAFRSARAPAACGCGDLDSAARTTRPQFSSMGMRGWKTSSTARRTSPRRPSTTAARPVRCQRSLTLT